jgi:hypothetical protein
MRLNHIISLEVRSDQKRSNVRLQILSHVSLNDSLHLPVVEVFDSLGILFPGYIIYAK